MKRTLMYIFIPSILISFGMNFTNAIQASNTNFNPQARETNVFFATYDGQKNQLIKTPSPDTEEARTNRECLPAKDFSEGNWGERVQGVQMSLRLAKTAFTNGEPIDTTVLVRNVTNESFFFSEYHKVKLGLFINFLVYDQAGQLVVSKPEYHGMRIGGFPTFIIPGAQRKYLECLNDSYELTNGNYQIEATIYTPERQMIKSAKVSLEIK